MEDPGASLLAVIDTGKLRSNKLLKIREPSPKVNKFLESSFKLLSSTNYKDVLYVQQKNGSRQAQNSIVNT